MTKVVLLAGGFGTRISEETDIKPKPMIEIGGMPVIWHIMKIFSFYGLNEFIICCGYKGYVIKEYFNNFYLHNSDITFDMSSNKMTIHKQNSENWKITLVDTGKDSMTGGRLKRIESYIDKHDDFFCMTYGDGLSNININNLIKFHQERNKLATVTATLPPGRFGVLDINSNHEVTSFREKNDEDESRINGGFFVLSPKIFNYIDNDKTVWEKDPLEKLASESNLVAFQHNGFWQPMDTLRDKLMLEGLWQSQKAPWKLWRD